MAGIAIDFGGDFSTGLGNFGYQAGTGVYIGANNWYAELGSYTYTSEMDSIGPTGIGATIGLGPTVNLYLTDAEDFFPGNMEYHSWTPGIFTFGFYNDSEGNITGYFISLGKGLGVAADECGTIEGTHHPLQ